MTTHSEGGAVKTGAIELLIAMLISSALLVGYGVMSSGLHTGAVFIVIAMAAPFIAVAYYWYAIPVIALFLGAIYLVFFKIDRQLVRISALTIIMLFWTIYGIRSFVLVTEGA